MNTVGVVGIIFIIVFLIIAIISTIVFFINKSKGKPNPWYIYTGIIVGYILFIVGIVMVAVGSGSSKEEEKEKRVTEEVELHEAPQVVSQKVLLPTKITVE